ncbi:MAG: hypothetical protein U9R39_05600 [Campylobacterota bacterium]|nr:hypothetical protein [Campylobacterota bacterium]
MKIILLTLFIVSGLLSSTINFKEFRYLAALDFEREKQGVLEIKENSLVLNYSKPDIETISYLSDKLIILKDDTLVEYSFEEYPKAEYMGLILKAIIKDEYESLDELFEIKKEEKLVSMIAKPIIYNTIVSIEVFKNSKEVSKIIINMINKDKITIETIY